MKTFPGKRLPPLVGYVTPALALIIIISTIGVVLGWITNIFFVQAFSRSFIPMAPSTAIIFFLLGLSLLPRSRRITEQGWNKLVKILTILSFVLSFILLVEFVLNRITSFHLDLEQILVEQYRVPGRFVAGRISPLTSILLVICSFSMFTSTFTVSTLFTRINEYMILLVTATSIVLLLGYMFGAPVLYGGTTIPVALPTSILLLLLSNGYLFQRPGRWFYDYTLDKSVFAILIKWLIPLFIGVFFILGLVNFYYTELLSKPGQAMVFAITTILSLIMVSLIVSFVAKYVQKLVTQAEQKLLDTNSELHALYNTAPIMMCTLDSKNKVLTANDFFQRNSKWTEDSSSHLYGPGNILGCINALDDPGGCGSGPKCSSCNLRKSLELTMEKRIIQHDVTYETTLVNGGSKRKVHMMASMAPIPDVTPPRIILCLVNVTELKERERELQALNAAQNKFLSIISHDLRSPFNTILGYTDLLLSNFDSQTTEENLKLLNRLQNSAHNTFKLLENLLEWSQLQAGHFVLKPEKIELSGLIEESVQSSVPYADQKQVSIDNQCNSKVTVLADAHAVTTVIRNLLNNAIKFSHPDTSVTVQCLTGQKECCVTISDQGIGMDESFKELLFRQDTEVKRPGTNREKGTGLGLLLVHELVRKNGGQIWVDSEQGKGSTFHFTIPM